MNLHYDTSRNYQCRLGANGFYAKYSSAGINAWAKKFGGTGSDYGYGVALDSSGALITTGSFEAGNPVFDFKPLTNSGSTDIVVGRTIP